AVMFNLDGTPGAIGRCPTWMGAIFPMAVVDFDVESEAPVRGSDGRCVRAADGAIGELISRIEFDPKKPAQRYDGYVDKAASEKKVLRDVFRPGDLWFRTGDLVRRDRHGYY